MTKARELIADAFYHVGCNATEAHEKAEKLIAALTDAGLVIVPREPTEKMWQAFNPGSNFTNIWRDLLTASQEDE